MTDAVKNEVDSELRGSWEECVGSHLMVHVYELKETAEEFQTDASLGKVRPRLKGRLSLGKNSKLPWRC